MTKIKIGGYEFNLANGHRYLAGRPFTSAPCVHTSAQRRHEKFTVTVTDITHGFTFNATPVVEVPGLSYAAANDLLDAFNNGESSFEGRLIG